MKKKKLKPIRKFLNPTNIDCSGVLSMHPNYNIKTGELLDISLTIRDCNRAVTLDFNANGYYGSIQERRRNLKNSIEKINILKEVIDSMREELMSVVLVDDKPKKNKPIKNEK